MTAKAQSAQPSLFSDDAAPATREVLAATDPALAVSQKFAGIRHDGKTFDARFDRARLNDQTRRVYEAMKDGQWRTLGEIHRLTGDPEASISARLRDLRKEKFGGFNVQRQRRGNPKGGIWEYGIVGAPK
jgi:hypothetical protein